MQSFDTTIVNPETYFEQLEHHKDVANVFRDDLAKCYKMVEEFIKRQGRILVGGMAIDFALKLKGDKLYNTEKIDYDFITPDYHTDAYNLGTELAKHFSEISIICARHINSMRIRYRFIPVADLTYVPADVFAKIQTLNYEGFKIIHPHFQIADQLRALSVLAEYPPRETYFGDRVIKDIKRFCMLSEHYPLSGISDNLKSFDSITTMSIKKSIVVDNCLGGMVSVIYWLKKLNINTDFDLVFEDTNIKVTMPKKYKISLFTDEIENVESLLDEKKQTEFHALLDKLPTRFVYNSIDVFNSKGTLFVADKINNIYVMGLFGSMLYLTGQWQFYDDEYAGILFKVLHQKLLTDFQTDVSLIPTNMVFFGRFNWSESYLLSIKRTLAMSKGQKLEGFLPKNAYPKKGEQVKLELYNFDPTKSELLSNNGKEKEKV